MSPRGLVTLCVKCHTVCQILYNQGLLFISFGSSKYMGTHTKKTHLLYQSLHCSHFMRPISSVKLQTNFLGIAFKMIHPHFQGIFPISYWRPQLSGTEGWSPCARSPAHFPLLFVIFSFQPSWWGPNCLKPVDESFVLCVSSPKSHTTQYISR